MIPTRKRWTLEQGSSAKDWNVFDDKGNFVFSASASLTVNPEYVPLEQASFIVKAANYYLAHRENLLNRKTK